MSEPLQLVTRTTLPAKEKHQGGKSFSEFLNFCLATSSQHLSYHFKTDIEIKDDIASKSVCCTICTITMGTMTFNFNMLLSLTFNIKMNNVRCICWVTNIKVLEKIVDAVPSLL